ncbi:hypothetical protein WJX81_000691 [Elliptochloris bilobata]|uniref:Uncharacterized protein n=1 Tax=Elliptochloris bilobata TaxID=381761 RepID=A0AAW1RZT1_9CHLO
MKGAVAVIALVALTLTTAFAGSPVNVPQVSSDAALKPVFDQYASLITSVLMQKEKNPENATKLLSNLVGVTGAHIDALDAQGMHDKFYFNFTEFTQPEIVTHVLNYTQTVGDAVSAWLPDHIGFDKFASNYSQSYAPGLTVSATGFSYAPCIISTSPVGAVVSATAITIDPIGVYITPEGSNFQPEGFKVVPSIVYIGSTGENIQPQGVNIAPALISISPTSAVKHLLGAITSIADGGPLQIISSLAAACHGGFERGRARSSALNPVFDQYASLITSVLMQKYGSPENAKRTLSNLAGVTGAHIDALDAQGMHDKFYFNFTEFTHPQIVTQVMDYTQAIGDAVSAWLPDHIGLDKFVANYSQSFEPGVTTSITGFSYSPCIISNLPTGVVISATAIGINPLGVYITPEGANMQPEGLSVLPSIIYISSTGVNIEPQGAQVAPTLISVSPVRSQVGLPRFDASPIGVYVGVEAAAPDSSAIALPGSVSGMAGVAETLPGSGR